MNAQTITRQTVAEVACEIERASCGGALVGNSSRIESRNFEQIESGDDCGLDEGWYTLAKPSEMSDLLHGYVSGWMDGESEWQGYRQLATDLMAADAQWRQMRQAALDSIQD